jgi:hypothetical protein
MKSGRWMSERGITWSRLRRIWGTLYVYSIAHQPKQLKLFKGANHGLDSVANEVYELVRTWIIEHLDAPAK